MISMQLFLTLVSLAPFVAAQDASNAEAGKLAAHSTSYHPPHFRPEGFTDKLTPYDLAKEFRDNKIKSDAGQASSYPIVFVKEFNDHYYPEIDFQWHKTGNIFRHVGIRKIGKDKVQEVFFSWTSLSDGLQWGFTNTEIERTTNGDRFAIVSDVKIAERIENSLRERKLIVEPKDVVDVFSYRTRSFRTDANTAGLAFPDRDFSETSYGVSVGNKVHFFTAQGETSSGRQWSGEQGQTPDRVESRTSRPTDSRDK